MQNALSPLDGRYEHKLDPLRKFFSEEALFFYRTLIEVRWLQLVAAEKSIDQCRTINAAENTLLESILENFSATDASRIRIIEKTTNHDVKAVEYFLKEKIADSSLADISEWIHFALTSEDVNNLSYALMLKDSIHNIVLPQTIKLSQKINELAKNWKNIPLLSRTHGQPASPTTMGKELLIFATRLQRQTDRLLQQEYLGKWGGASGNLNAHAIAFPKTDWLKISEQFVTSLGLSWNPVVPQIEPHDFIAEIGHGFIRCGNILIDFSRDAWGYISLGYFSQKTNAGEVGSSAMPHKVNPIDFENAEGNLGLANALFTHFAEKLPISRWQRDLSDSTVLRNLGVAFGHYLLALQNLEKGIGKLKINRQEILKDLQNNPEVLAEAAQTVMRANGIEKPYEKLKQLTRGKRITIDDFRDFISALSLPESEKARLKKLTPETYLGLAEEIVDRFA